MHSSLHFTAFAKFSLMAFPPLGLKAVGRERGVKIATKHKVQIFIRH
jgi:hypothetical protein